MKLVVPVTVNLAVGDIVALVALPRMSQAPGGFRRSGGWPFGEVKSRPFWVVFRSLTATGTTMGRPCMGVACVVPGRIRRV